MHTENSVNVSFKIQHAENIAENYGNAATVARGIYNFRRKRSAAFPEVADLFHDPIWDILLDLFAAAERGQEVSISSACIGAAVPPTTGLRALGILQERGFVEFQNDPLDKRRRNVTLTSLVKERMFALLTQAQPT